jgi:type II secretory pathway pseudopilin PulG
LVAQLHSIGNYEITNCSISNMNFTAQSRRGSRAQGQRGYILITLMLFVALLAIAAAAIAPSVVFESKRDREEELIHRGVQYARAVRRYVKKFGRYPTRIEDLENTNNLRFLRKRYKDPITGKDFKLLHLGEVQMTFAPGIAGAQAVGLNPANLQQLSQSPVPGVNGPSGPGTQVTAGGDMAPAAQNPNEQQPGNQVFGGGPIVGVASTSKDKTIRVFNKKEHYYQWQFIYDPSTDRGGLLNTPAQPPLQGAIPAGQPGMPGAQPGMPGGQPGLPSGIPGQPTPPSTPQPSPSPQ